MVCLLRGVYDDGVTLAGVRQVMLYNEIMPMLSIRDVARLLHIHVNTARRWSDQGILKAYRITRRGDRRFRQEDIARFLAEYNDFNFKKTALRE
jgi:excisionase family DNA binding protein